MLGNSSYFLLNKNKNCSLYDQPEKVLETLTLKQGFLFLGYEYLFSHTSLKMVGCKRKGNGEAVVLQHLQEQQDLCKFFIQLC